MEMWKKTVSRQAEGQMFGGQMFRGEGVALVCLRDPHGWNIEGRGNHVRYEVEEERGCLCQLLGLELMPSANGIHQGAQLLHPHLSNTGALVFTLCPWQLLF